MVFSRSDEIWAKKRKNFSAAFYKDKLLSYFNMIKEGEQRSDQVFREFARSGKQMNIVQEIMQLHIRIILKCAFGQDVSEE